MLSLSELPVMKAVCVCKLTQQKYQDANVGGQTGCLHHLHCFVDRVTRPEASLLINSTSLKLLLGSFQPSQLLYGW